MGNPELSLGWEVVVGSGRVVPRIGGSQGPQEMLCVPGAEGKPLAVGAGLLEAAVLVMRGFFKLCLWEGSTKDIGQA